jgi:acetolactate synthase-1/2/3 large subunit
MFSQFKVYGPGTYFALVLFIAMGYSLPAAIKAKVVFPECAVVPVSGSRGLLMGCGELATANKYFLRAVSIVIDDGC